MPQGIRRQGATRAALLWSLALAGALPFGATLMAGDSDPWNIAPAIPRIIRDARYDNLVHPSQKSGDTAQRTGEGADQAARGRAVMEARVKVVKRPSSAKAARKEAASLLPLDKMTDAHRRRVLEIVNANSLFRELPTLRFQVDPRVYTFFMQHPEVAVGIWRVMQISDFRMRQTGVSGYETNDGDGTSGVIDVAHRGRNEAVVLCDGVYKSPLLPKAIQANGVLHLQVRFEREPNGRIFATHTARIFVFFPSQTVDAVARIMSPLSNAIIDQNFREVSLFLHMMTTAMERQPGWVEHVSNRLEGLPEERKTQLMEVTVEVYAEANPRLIERRRREQRLDGEAEEHSLLKSPTRTASREELETPDDHRE